MDFKHVKTQIKSTHGFFELHCFSWGNHEEDQILTLHKNPNNIIPIVRVQSACYTAEIFRSLDCDCHEQLSLSLKLIQKHGGLLIYMLCDGRGAGLYNKITGLELGRKHGLDTADAYIHLGLEVDPREYSRVVKILQYFRYKKIKLLTNNPRKIEALRKNKIEIFHEPLEINATNYSKNYLKTKAKKMGHMLKQFK